MRIWDLPVEVLCRQHLLGEHRELHAIWSILINDKKGYRKHPEVMRWEGKLPMLWIRHELQVKEMHARGYNHKSPLNESPSGTPRAFMLERINTLEEQVDLLRAKGCACKVVSAVDRLAAIAAAEGRT